MSTVQSGLFLDVTKELLSRGHRVRFRAEGDSMYPTIRSGEAIVVEPIAPADLKQGDIALYRAARGITAHRVIGIEGGRFLIRGDGTGLGAEPVGGDQILGKVVKVESNRGRADLGTRRTKMNSFMHIAASRMRGWATARGQLLALAVTAFVWSGPVMGVTTPTQVRNQITAAASTNGTNVTIFTGLSINLGAFVTDPGGATANYLAVGISSTGNRSVSSITGCITAGPSGSWTYTGARPSQGGNNTEIWVLKNPTGGAVCNPTITMSNTASIVAGAVLFTGVSTAATPWALAGTAQLGGNAASRALTLTTSIPPNGAALVVLSTSSVASSQCPVLSAVTGEDSQWSLGAAASNACSSTNSFITGAGATTASLTGTPTFTWTAGGQNMGNTTFVAIVLSPGSVTSPTAVKVSSFTAAPDQGGNLIQLETGRDVNNLGFNLYREDNGQRVKLNASLLAGTALMGGAGTTFTAGQTRRWRDAGASAGASYWLEEVDLNGTRTWYGPAVAGAAEVAAADSTGAAQTLNSTPTPSGRANAPDDAVTVADEADKPIFLKSIGSVTGTGSINAATAPMKTTFTKAAQASAAITTSEMQQQYAVAAGAAVRLDVQSEGWYRVTQSQLVAAGIAPGVDPRNLQLYVNGVQQPILVEGEADGTFDASDAVAFYGMGMDTLWSGTQAYWLVAGTAKGLRMAVGGAAKKASGAASFPATVIWKPRTMYASAILNGDGNNYFGPVITNAAVNQPLTVTNLNLAGGASKLQVKLQGGTTGSHVVAVALNGTFLGNVTFNGQSSGAATFTVPAVNEGANLLTLTGSSPSDVTAVDEVQFTYPHSYTADGDYLRFTAPAGKATTIGGFSSSAITAIDVTDPANPSLVMGTIGGSAGNYTFTLAPTAGKGTRLLLALTGGQTKTPTLTANAPSSWNAAQAGYGMVIISHASLMASAAPLAGLRQSQGLNVAVIDVQDLYDEFSFGVKSPAAIKSFLATARANWSIAPQYVLLFGNGTFDPREFMNFTGTTVPDLVPVKLIDTKLLETASDDWFVDFDDDSLPDMAIGRLPAASASEADLMVARLVAYDTVAPGAWKDEALLVTGKNLYPGDDFVPLSAGVEALLPGSLTVTNLYATDPNPQSTLLASLNSGQALVNFIGHGSNEVWSGLFSSSNAMALGNATRTPVVLAMTCLNGFFQDRFTNPLGKALLKAANGGAVAVWASSGLTEPEPQADMNRAMVNALYGTTPMTLGEAAAAAKAGTTDKDVRRTWILLGDPSMVLQ